MQNTGTIIRQPILLGLLLSIAVHAVVLYSRGIYTPPLPKMETGRTVVQLTLLPSRANPASSSETVSVPSHESTTLQQAMLPVIEDEMAETVTTESTEQEATLEKNKGVTTEAAATSTFRPSYPRISKNRGEEGSVLLEVQVLTDGTTGMVKILKSSGYKRLDKAALEGAQRTTFIPASRLGQVVESTTQLSFTFRLTDD